MHLRMSKSGLAAVGLSGTIALATAAGATAVGASAHGVSPAKSGPPTSISVASFTSNFSAMASLKSLAAEGSGKIAAILPDTTSSTRYVEFDQPDILKAAADAGLPSSDVIVQNAGGSDQTFITDAQGDVSNGVKVLLIDPEDSGTGVSVEKYAAAHGVKVIDYDRLDLGGPADPYVSFNNVQVGKLIGTGFEACAAAWGVKHPNVIMMRGAPTDNNATLFYDGYFNDVLNAKFKSGAYTLAAQTAGTWTPSDAQTEFEQALSAHSSANSAVIPNDENGAPIITYLKSHGVKPRSFPTTGQDATLTGLQNILSGYQCGTVYKAVYKEAQASVALALYLRAGKQAPRGLENGSTIDVTNHDKVPSVLLTPEWVTNANMKSTIIADNFVPKAQLCAGSYASDCKKDGIS